MFVPEIVTTLRGGYTRRQLLADLQAGVIVGIVALPLAIAFAIASGVTPDRGLYTAIVAGFIISAFGGSRVQIGGPTGAFVVIVCGVVQKYGVDGLTVATLMAGVLLIALGAARLGGAIKFVPHPVVIGFTSGIAVVIFSSQVKDVLGLRMGAVPAPFVEKWEAYAANLGTANWYAVALAGPALVIMNLWPKVSHRIPGPFVALIATTVAVRALHLPVETIGSRFGAISASLPHPVVPHLPRTSSLRCSAAFPPPAPSHARRRTFATAAARRSPG
jgi:SulP family sulfate permease